MNILAEIREEKAVLEGRRAEVEAKKSISYEVQATKVRKVDLKGDVATNCSRCNMTCHSPCKQMRDSGKLQCEVLDPFSGRCMVCLCDRAQHVKTPHRLEAFVVKETRTLKDMRAQRQVAETVDAEGLLVALKKRYEESRSSVVSLLRRAHEKLRRLDEIALKPNPMTIADYVKLLISSEKHEGRPGWMERARILQEIWEKIENEETVGARGNIHLEKLKRNSDGIKPNCASGNIEPSLEPMRKKEENRKAPEKQIKPEQQVNYEFNMSPDR